jgi:hypothetical protein
MSLPPPETPLYNHPLPEIETWLSDLGCQQDREDLHHWTIERPTWQADLYLESEELKVCYLKAAAGGGDIQRSFKYSLSRQDIEYAVFFGP